MRAAFPAPIPNLRFERSVLRFMTALRPHKELTEDPSFPFQVGRLIGAAEITGQLLMAGKLSAEELGDVGRRLHATTDWFLIKSGEKLKPQ